MIFSSDRHFEVLIFLSTRSTSSGKTKSPIDSDFFQNHFQRSNLCISIEKFKSCLTIFLQIISEAYEFSLKK